MWETGGQVRPPLHTTAESVCVIPCHSEPSPQTGRGNPFSAPTGAVLPPYAPSDAPRERPLPLPLGEVAERSEDGEGKQKRTALLAVLQLVDKPILSFRGAERRGNP